MCAHVENTKVKTKEYLATSRGNINQNEPLAIGINLVVGAHSQKRRIVLKSLPNWGD